MPRAAADVLLGNVYYYFKTKDGLPLFGDSRGRHGP
jgi:hypothetical protein